MGSRSSSNTVITTVVEASQNQKGKIMPATVITREIFDGSISEEKIQEESNLRIKAGAIRSSFSKKDGSWILVTEWNVIGEQ